ncbi:MAG: DUF1028 domain-containing protein [Acidobacteria bacterium]|nr:DUF1028 domain-containing protein [Acidobacteriota bacterium]
MRKTALILAVLFLFEGSAFATWSVIAIDRNTRRVAMAAASCVNTTDDAMKNAIAVVVPGIGLAVCQAAADNTGQNQLLVFNELKKGTDPRRIIELLAADPQFQSRQFGVLDMEGRSAGHSGLGNGFVAQYISGQVPGTEIFYAIQGNILRATDVVPTAVKAFIETKGALTDRVMAALEAADRVGGDSRCACPADTTGLTLPCDNKTSHVAYILMADPTDTNGDSYNNGKYALYIPVSQPAPDRPNSAKAGESLNPVRTLRMRYDAWRRTMPADYR